MSSNLRGMVAFFHPSPIYKPKELETGTYRLSFLNCNPISLTVCLIETVMLAWKKICTGDQLFVVVEQIFFQGCLDLVENRRKKYITFKLSKGTNPRITLFVLDPSCIKKSFLQIKIETLSCPVTLKWLAHG